MHNGTLGTVLNTTKDGGLTIETQGAKQREVKVDTKEFNDIRLAYVQHVYKAQGLTAERALVLTGGWQTDRERAYVALTRAREQTDIYVSREDLGEQGMDTGAIERLANAMAESHAQEASITRPTIEHQPERSRGHEEPRDHDHGADLQTDRDDPADRSADRDEPESEVGRIMRESQEQRDREQDRGLDHEIE